jgi:hypothetical protein
MSTSKDAGGIAGEQTTRWGAMMLEELQEMGPPDWLIDGVLPAEGVAEIYAAKGAGKTLLAVSVAASVASGTDWHGKTVKPGTVLYVATEGFSGMGARLTAWELASGVSLDDAPLYVISEPVDLLTEAEEFAAAMRERYGEVRLIVFDTLSKSTRSGKDQKDNSEMAKVIAGAEIIARALGGLSLIVHHSTKDGRTSRGGYALDCDADTVLRLDRDRARGTVKVTCQNQRDAGDGWSLTLNVKHVDLGGQYPKGSLVLVGKDDAKRPASFAQVYTALRGDKQAIIARMGLTDDQYRQRKSRMERAKRGTLQAVA